MFAGLGLGTGSNEYGSAGVLVYGVFLGSACWWLLLSSGISLFRARFDAQTLGWINKLSGIIIAGFGLIALVSVVRR
jgi:arginine exporter protein ArgO